MATPGMGFGFASLNPGSMSAGIAPNEGWRMAYAQRLQQMQNNNVSNLLGGGAAAGGMGAAYGVGGGMGGLMQAQLQRNRETRDYNRGLWNTERDYTSAVPERFRADPVYQGARTQAQALVNDPEALNDATQQKIINRTTNMRNALFDSARGKERRQLAARGQLGGSAERQSLERLERGRAADLMRTVTDLEVQRANQRNRDIMAATQLAQGVAGQEAGLYGQAAATRMAGVPYESPEDLSGFGALLGALGQGSQLSMGGIGNGLGQRRKRNDTPQAGFGLTMPEEGPSWSPYGLPYGTQPATYSSPPPNPGGYGQNTVPYHQTQGIYPGYGGPSSPPPLEANGLQYETMFGPYWGR